MKLRKKKSNQAVYPIISRNGRMSSNEASWGLPVAAARSVLHACITRLVRSAMFQNKMFGVIAPAFVAQMGCFKAICPSGHVKVCIM